MYDISNIKKVVRLEGDIEKTCVKKIKDYFKERCYEIPKPIRPSSKGSPDRQFCIEGKYIAIEFKRPKNSKTAKAQLDRIDEIKKSGGVAFLATCWEDIATHLNI